MIVLAAFSTDVKSVLSQAIAIGVPLFNATKLSNDFFE